METLRRAGGTRRYRAVSVAVGDQWASVNMWWCAVREADSRRGFRWHPKMDLKACRRRVVREKACFAQDLVFTTSMYIVQGDSDRPAGLPGCCPTMLVPFILSTGRR
jgi:hypothetical protein